MSLETSNLVHLPDVSFDDFHYLEIDMNEATSKIVPSAIAGKEDVVAASPASLCENAKSGQTTRHLDQMSASSTAIPHWKTRLSFYKSLFLMLVPLMLDIQDIIYKLHIGLQRRTHLRPKWVVSYEMMN